MPRKAVWLKSARLRAWKLCAPPKTRSAATARNSSSISAPPLAPDVVPQRNPQAAAQAAELLYGGSALLLIPDSANDRVMAFDATTGNLVDADFIPSDSTNLTLPKNAILSASGSSILVSDQSNDVVLEYDLAGNYLGIFAPAGGPNTAILDNILGIALRPNGNLLVTVTGGSNQDSVAEFDAPGIIWATLLRMAREVLTAPLIFTSAQQIGW
ncbi:MAG: hypothetical protein HC804_05475 [Anaerolineae bacterium]|nr:hypothetical protein [Anaerolineae bacterium]